MATQGLLSIVINGQVVAKAVTGCDGYEMPSIAKDVKKNGVTTAQGLLDLCREHGLGGESLIVQSSPSTWTGDYSEDELPELYANKFNDPYFNPRWKYGTAEYIEVVDMSSNVTKITGLGSTKPERRYQDDRPN